MPARNRKDRGRIARHARLARHLARARPLPEGWLVEADPSRQYAQGRLTDHAASGNTLQLSILLLATDRVAGEALTAALMGPGHGVTTVADPIELFASAPGYSLVIMDQVPPPFTVAAVIEELRRDESTKLLPVLAVAQNDDLEERIGLLEAGADDVITKPFDHTELEARVEALSLRFQRSRDRSALVLATTPIGDARGRRIVSIVSPKGGVGTTTIATNLALIAGERNPSGVLLIDFDLSFGQVSSHLNLQPKQTLLELARDEAALREAELFRTYAVHPRAGSRCSPRRSPPASPR